MVITIVATAPIVQDGYLFGVNVYEGGAIGVGSFHFDRPSDIVWDDVHPSQLRTGRSDDEIKQQIDIITSRLVTELRRRGVRPDLPQTDK